MTLNATQAFLECVLPADGLKVAVVFDTLKPRPGVDFPRQIIAHDFAQLADVLLFEDAKGSTVVYHACAAYRDREGVVDARTGKRKFRTAENAIGAKALWLDADAGEGKPYATAAEAAEALVHFTHAARLPLPLFVGSGSGVHAYWPLSGLLDVGLWTRYATGLKSLCVSLGLRVDPVRTADIASILRPPGTHNRKAGSKLVECGPLVGPYDIALFSHLLEAAPVAKPSAPKSHSLAARILSGSSFSASYADLIADQCAQLNLFRERHGDIAEPLWYAGLGVLSRCEDGAAKAHEWSSGYAGYTEQETQHKLERTLALSGPTTCAKFDAVSPAVCGSCPHRGQITSPIALGQPDPAGAGIATGPIVNPLAPGAGDDDKLPELPAPFCWTTRGQLVLPTEDSRGSTTNLVISQYPIYLDGVQTGEVDSSAFSYTFKQYLPSVGWISIVVRARELMGPGGIALLSDKGATIHDGKAFMSYVRAAVDEFHTGDALQTKYDQYGWKEDDTAFLFGSLLYRKDHIQTTSGNREVEQRNQWIKPMTTGSLAKWTEAVNMLFAIGCEAQSVALLAGFAAPLQRFHSTTEGGAILQLVSDGSGTGKSTALAGAASVWGVERGLSLTNIDTKVSKAVTLGVLGNLPVIYDELANRDPDAIKEFVLTFTNGRDRMRGSVDGTIHHTLASWQTILISAANLSIIDLLGTGGTDAPAFRVLELPVALPKGLRIHKGDALKKTLEANAGWAGDAYLRYILQPEVLAWIKQALAQWTEQLWERTKLGPEHRFRIRALGSLAVASAIVRKMGLVDFQVDRIMEWTIEQVLRQRFDAWITTDQHGQPAEINRATSNVLAQFINDHQGELLVVDKPFKPQQTNIVLHEPRGKVCGRYETEGGRLYIERRAFTNWCLKQEISPRFTMRKLQDMGVVVNPARSATLTAGTRMPGAQVQCIEINGKHPNISGLITEVGKPEAANVNQRLAAR